MPSSTNNVNLGVCSVHFGASTPVDLGYTKGGVDVALETETYTVMVDQFGNTAIKQFVLGRNITVTTPLAETTLENMEIIVPGSVKVTNAVPASKLEIYTSASRDLFQDADELVLHPIAAGADLSQDFVVPKAITPGNFTFAYKLDEERVFNCEWSAFPDSTGLIAIYGDKSITAA